MIEARMQQPLFIHWLGPPFFTMVIQTHNSKLEWGSRPIPEKKQLQTLDCKSQLLATELSWPWCLNNQLSEANKSHKSRLSISFKICEFLFHKIEIIFNNESVAHMPVKSPLVVRIAQLIKAWICNLRIAGSSSTTGGVFSGMCLKQASDSKLLVWVRITTLKNWGPNQWIRVQIAPGLKKIHLSLFVKSSQIMAGYGVKCKQMA